MKFFHHLKTAKSITDQLTNPGLLIDLYFFSSGENLVSFFPFSLLDDSRLGVVVVVVLVLVRDMVRFLFNGFLASPLIAGCSIANVWFQLLA